MGKNALELLQEEYFNETVQIFDFNKISDYEVDCLVDKLLGCIPNDKHLFKYKSFDSKYFEEDLSNIKDGEIFLPQASLLNDKIDCSFNYQTLRTDEEIFNYIKTNVYAFHLLNLKATGNKSLLIDKEIKFDVLEKLSKNLPNEKIASSIKYNSSYRKKLSYVFRVINEAESYVLSDEYLKETFVKYRNLGEYMRNRIHVFSLCESCYQDSMWAYYSNNNNGYCIEYDLNRIKNLDPKTKRQLLSFYKVEYSNYQQPIDSLDLFEIVILPKKKATSKGQNVNKKILKSFITKSTSWEHEKEWRIILEGEQNIVKADLVCGVIIDEDCINSERAKKLVETARKKQLIIKVRHLDRKTNTFQMLVIKE